MRMERIASRWSKGTTRLVQISRSVKRRKRCWVSDSRGTSSPSTPQRPLTDDVAPSRSSRNARAAWVISTRCQPSGGRRCGRRSPRRGHVALEARAAAGREEGQRARGGAGQASHRAASTLACRSVPGASRRRGRLVVGARRGAGAPARGREPAERSWSRAPAPRGGRSRAGTSPATKPADVREEGDPAATCAAPTAPNPF